MACDPRGNEMLRSLEKVLSAKQAAAAQEQAAKLQQGEAKLSAMSFAQ